MTLTKITAPWTPEQVDLLNAAQKNQYLHAFTCPGDGPGCGSMHETRDLIATVDGWICTCGRYRQKWAYAITPALLGEDRPGPFTNRQKMDCARREVALRRGVYKLRVEQGRTSQATADKQIALMEAIAEDYRLLAEADEREERLL